MIDLMSWWVNELFGNKFIALLMLVLLYDVIMFLGRLSMIVILIISALVIIVFSGLLWGSWLTVFIFLFSVIYFGYAVIKWAGPPQ
jgi:hypothetical protein